jgi:hypothetical protein|tara:strand:- start:232 stop:549 length:318 start_codon:yes stop_codon:yes gene_type:complete
MTKKSKNLHPYAFHIRKIIKHKLAKGNSTTSTVAPLLSLILERAEASLMNGVVDLVTRSNMNTVSAKHVKASVRANWPHKLGKDCAQAVCHAESAFKESLFQTST